MSEYIKTNKTVLLLIVVVGGIITAGAIFAIVNKSTPEPENVEKSVTAPRAQTIEQSAYIERTERVEQTQSVALENLEEIIKSAGSWGPVFKPWFGKEAPDFTVTDIKGQKHNLKDYLGKNVLVVFWATWCPACNLEIPHLIELRKEIGEDELAIIAISNEESELLKKYAAGKGINYTVATVGSSFLPSPFIDVTSIPTTFFIDKNGQIKLAAVGLVELDDSKAILKAEQ
ncbi:MAG: TlpA family protein disulfide reductase [Sedimentisphaerales bacterium]|nr:TlpA family protein disulfide reductase [Sedimentisphaerales bacterium]